MSNLTNIKEVTVSAFKRREESLLRAILSKWGESGFVSEVRPPVPECDDDPCSPITRANMRYAFRLLGSALTARSIQSPAFFQTHASEENQGQTSQPRYFDYKRSRHHEARRCEEMLVRRIPSTSARALLFNSGMAAVTTAVLWANRDELDPNSKILCGASCYYESKLIYQSVFGSRLLMTDDSRLDAIMDSVLRVRPAALFLDSISTGETLNAIDIKGLLDIISLEYHEPLLILVDSTCDLDAPMLGSLPLPPTISFLCIESLAKYHQCGLDTATGGIVWSFAPPEKASRLEKFREYAGTNISDASIGAIPMLACTIDEALYREASALRTERLRLHEAAATQLAKHLHASGKFRAVFHPSLVSPADFSGSLITVRLALQDSSSERCTAFIQRAIETARTRSLPLVGGASFGFDVTRLFPSNLSLDSNDFYLRIATGIMNEVQVSNLAEILEGI